VDHQLHVAPRERGHVGLVSRLPQAVDRVHRVELLGGIADEHEHLLHCAPPVSLTGRQRIAAVIANARNWHMS
jgi:hypothetical protein